MKAILFNDDRSIQWTNMPTPEPGPGEVRVKIEATAINRADLVQRAGHYPPPPGASPVPGLECVGIIDAIGNTDGSDNDVVLSSLTLGDRVCALLTAGGYAEYVTCPASHCLADGN